MSRELKDAEKQIRIRAEETNTEFGQTETHGDFSKSNVNVVIKIG